MAERDSADVQNALASGLFIGRVNLVAVKAAWDVMLVAGGAVPGDPGGTPAAEYVPMRMAMAKEMVAGTTIASMPSLVMLDADVRAAVLTDPANGPIKPTDVQIYTAVLRAFTAAAVALNG